MQRKRSIIKNISYFRVLFPTLLTIALLITAIFIVVIPQFENIVIDRKREMIRELTNSTLTLINDWYAKEISNEIGKAEAQRAAIDQVGGLRYGIEMKDYFWITDKAPTMIVHPYRADLNGKDLSNFEDSHGKKLFVDMVKVVEQNGEGYVDYMWQWKDDTTRIVPKVSFVKLFKPWGWVIGTGIYIEDVKQEIALLEQKIITISIIITILSSILLTYIALQNIKSESQRKQAEEELNESREKYRLLAEASGEGLILILENQKVFYNSTVYSLLGYKNTNVELKLSDIFQSFPDLQIFDLNSLKMKRESEINNEKLETKFKKQDGELLNVFLSISQISFLNVQGIVISVKDISRHKEIEKELDYSKEKYFALTNQIAIGAFRITADKKGKFIEYNQAIIKMLDYESEEEFKTTSLYEFFVDGEDIKYFQNEINDRGVIKNRIVELSKISGEKFTASLSAVLMRANEIDNLSIDGIIDDISEKRKLDLEKEQLISDLQKTLFVLNQKITPFIKNVPACTVNTKLADAVSTMSEKKSKIIFVNNEEGNTVGIFSDHDLKRVFSFINTEEALIKQFMSAPVYSIESNSAIYNALVIFREHSVRYLAVNDFNKNIIGVLALDDLFEASYSNYLFFLEKIEKSNSIEEIIDYRNQLLVLIKNMIHNDVASKNVTNFIAMVSDSITKRIIQLSIKELGPAPIEFSFIAMGSEGREEQTLLTDQDNAIIYEDLEKTNEAEIKNYFNLLGSKISDYLNLAGYQYCKGGIMAKNEKWCQPLSHWKKIFTHWVTTANPQDLLESKIFFDFRYIYGNSDLVEQLKNHVEKLVKTSSTFFVYLTENILNAELPANIQKLKNEVDLKLILLPIVDFARLYGLKHSINSVNTNLRLEQLSEKGVFSYALFKKIQFLYNYIMQTRLKHQAHLSHAKLPVSNSINPNSLLEIDISTINLLLSLNDELKYKIKYDFKGTVNI
ncbi:MAG: PAS domain S-box protein [Ignavibacteria bacterium]|nr:PAS domain S-box protein [Ignavibacteria bacterium]